MLENITDHQIQSDKEDARRLALKLGFVLERRGLIVESVDRYGNRSVLSQSKGENTVWQQAREAIEALVGVEKTTINTAPEAVSHLYIYTDGGSRGNPGPSASGFVIYDSSMKILEEGGEYLGITTNNQAEYHALRLALEKAHAYGSSIVTVRMDSLLVVNQMKGTYKVKNQDLWPVHTAIKKLALDFAKVHYEHIPRAQNSVADAMVNKILDAQTV